MRFIERWIIIGRLDLGTAASEVMLSYGAGSVGQANYCRSWTDKSLGRATLREKLFAELKSKLLLICEGDELVGAEDCDGMA